ncbi:hypothetical protein CsSME_00053580 [Camellia sinensis var. sinensis]
MAEAVMSFTVVKPHIHNSLQTTKLDLYPSSKSLRQWSISRFSNGWHQIESSKSKRGSLSKVNALPDWPLMAVLVEHIEGQRDLITHKSIWHLNDEAIKNVCKYLLIPNLFSLISYGYGLKFELHR